ncbi:hemicentin-1-like [Ostrinia furnacalis]|uniref:hemicentin-1-like n=1 Tax=Ostrinia furnacalis TaxID=93504 RepID=UPI00103B25DA|nr:hemicentin-1-like [Ostrinia furnacalis]
MKWVFYVVVFVYMFYRAVYGAKVKEINSLSVDPVEYEKYGNYFLPGSVKTIACKYSNKNQQVEWIDPSGKPISQVKTNRIFAQKHLSQMLHGDRIPSLLLAFTDAWVEDSGQYECRSGDLSETISICVIDPLTFVDTPAEVSVDEGRSYTLTCEARGQPEPRLVWTWNGEEIADDNNSTKYKVMTKFNNQGFQGMLTVMSVEASDAGVYACEAIQEHEDMEDCSVSKTWNITMHVNYAPVFVDGNETVLFAKINDSIEFECEASGYPVPTYRWFYELQEQTLLNYPPEKVILSDDDTKSKVTITANALTYGVKYVCEAKNNFGEMSKTFSVLKLEKPRKPSEINVYNATANQVELTVVWPVELAFPINIMEVQYLNADGLKSTRVKESDWKSSKPIKYVVEDIDNDGVAKVKIDELEPETEYLIRLRGVNGLGSAPWSAPVLASTTAEEEETTEEGSGDEDDDPKSEKDAVEEARTDTMFYGIFFAGGIFVIAFACMVFMRLV